MIKEVIESVKCKKVYSLSYNEEIFDMMLDKKRRIGGNYPFGGEVKAKVDEELLKALEKAGYENIKVGDCVVMRNGWSLD